MKKLYGWLIFIGFVLALGTAGASECGSISGRQETVQLIISVALMIGGALGIELRERKNDSVPDTSNTGNAIKEKSTVTTFKV